MAVPGDGVLPRDGLFPALIQWTACAHPAGLCPTGGWRLAEVAPIHPQGAGLERALRGLRVDPRVRVAAGPGPALRIGLDTPAGRVWLGSARRLAQAPRRDRRRVAPGSEAWCGSARTAPDHVRVLCQERRAKPVGDSARLR